MILVTGGTGFIGSHLVESLTGKGYNVRCLVRKTSDVSFLKALDVELIYGDIMDVDSLKSAVRDVEIVYHLVGGGNVSSVSRKDYIILRNLNVLGTKNILKACIHHADIQKFILFSSISAIGIIKNVIVNEETRCQPRTPHELAKYESEQVALMFCKKYGIPLLIIRPAQVYGPRDVKSEILKMCKLIKRHMFPVIGSGENVVPLVYVENLVHAAILACERDASSVYIVTDEWRTMNEIVEAFAKELNVRVWGAHVPPFAAKICVGMIEYTCRMLGITPPFNLKRLESITSNRLYDISKAKRELGYAPEVSFEEGIRRTVRWYKQHGYL